MRGTGDAVTQSGFRAPAAGKTGTTNDGADTWFVGYTPEIVAGVWIGFDQVRPIVPKATGGRLAAPVWARMMMRVYAGRTPPGPWPLPAGVVEGLVDPQTGLLLAPGCKPWSGVAYKELFIQGAVPMTVCPSQGQIMTAELPPLPALPDYEEGMQTGIPPEDLPRPVTPAEVARGGEETPPSPSAPVARGPVPAPSAVSPAMAASPPPEAPSPAPVASPVARRPRPEPSPPEAAPATPRPVEAPSPAAPSPSPTASPDAR